MTGKIPGPAVSEKADAETSPVLPPEMIEAGAAVLRDFRFRSIHDIWPGDWHETNAAAQATYLAMFAVLVEAGYSLKPQKPTAKMIAAGKNVRFPTPQTVWAAMCRAEEEE